MLISRDNTKNFGKFAIRGNRLSEKAEQWLPKSRFYYFNLALMLMFAFISFSRGNYMIGFWVLIATVYGWMLELKGDMLNDVIKINKDLIKIHHNNVGEFERLMEVLKKTEGMRITKKMVIKDNIDDEDDLKN